MSVTLKDLAKASGVSIGTVSRALNDKNEVSEKTSERIRQLAQELGYVPNRAGRALSSQKSINYIGVTLPSINSPFFDDIKKGINNALREFKDLGFDVVLKEQEGWDSQTQIKMIDELEAVGCKSFIVCAFDCDEIREKLDELNTKGYPTVILNNFIPDCKKLCFVGPDYEKQGRIAACMVDKCKYKQKINLLGVVGSKHHLGHMNRIAGFKSCLESLNHEYEVVDIIEGEDQDIVTQQVVMKTLSEYPEINVVFIATGGGVSGLGAALIADGDQERFAVGCDEIYTTKELVKNNIIDFVVTQGPEIQGYQAVKKIHDYFNKISSAHTDYIVEAMIKVKGHFE